VEATEKTGEGREAGKKWRGGRERH